MIYPPYLLFKTPLVKERADSLCIIMSEIMIKMASYCAAKSVVFMVTETVTTLQEDIKLARVSASHRENRAIDISLKGWSEEFIAEFIKEFESIYMFAAPLGKQSGKPSLIVRHNVGYGDHLHVQVAHVYASKTNPKSLKTVT